MSLQLKHWNAMKRWLGGLVLASLWAPVQAQLTASPPPAHAPVLPSVPAVGGEGAVASDPAAAPGHPAWRIVPRIGLDLTLTDNVAPANGKKEGDLVTKITPGLQLWGKGGRLSGSLDYQWSQLYYADHGQFDNHQQSLRAQGLAELVDQWLFLDASASIAQQPVSVFGLQSTSNELATGNRTETSAWRLSPYLKGVLANRFDYQLRYDHARTDANAGTVAHYGGTTSDTWSARLAGDTPLTVLGWSLDVLDQKVELGNQPRRLENRRWAANLDYRPDPQWRVLLGVGREEDNYSLLDLRRRTFSSLGLEWAPTERSLLSLRKDRHSYGDSHQASFTHRTAQSAWRFSDTRAISLPGQQLLTAPLSTAFELFDLQLRGQYPDPLARAAAVQSLLQQLGIPADTLVYGNVLTAQAFEQRRKEASFSLTGVNNTLTFTLQRSLNRRIGGALGLGDDFSLSDTIRQRGASASWAHQLSPDSTLTLTGTTSRSSGTTQTTKMNAWSLLYTTRLGIRTTASAGLRRIVSEGSGGLDYDENALTGALLVTF